MTCLWLWAQMNDITGIISLGGWAGAGLLGCVLAWLLFLHLPNKDKQLKEFIDAKDRHVETMVANCETEIQSLADQFAKQLHESRVDYVTQLRESRMESREALAAVLKQSTEQTTMMATMIKKDLENLTSVIAAQSSLLSMIQRELAARLRSREEGP